MIRGSDAMAGSAPNSACALNGVIIRTNLLCV
jgi:hypothetical protein